MSAEADAAAPSERIQTLDVLRGIALLGMFVVHFSNYSSGGTALDDAWQKTVELLGEGRFWTMFGILFGAGFALQLRRADARGEPFVARHLRRMAGLAAFGCVAHAVFGFNVLLGYAAWGLPLLLVRTWAVPALLAAVVLSAASGNIWILGRAAHGVATRGEAAVLAEHRDDAAQNAAFRETNRKAQEAPQYPAVFAARLQHMRWFYAQWYSYLPVNTFTLFLLGMLGLRLGLFEQPDRHRRLIAALMLFGAASWAVSTWPPYEPPAPRDGFLLQDLLVARLAGGFGLVRDMWLAFTYLGGVLLLVAWRPAWLRWLAVFGWTGRMALTNYMVQIAILDLGFANYALGLAPTPLAGLAGALALFAANAVLSRWWLARFRYGPLEWLWRSITQARWQPWRVAAPDARPRAPLPESE